MHTFINSRPMAQLVAFDLMADEARRAEVRRARWEERRAAAAARAEAAVPSAPRTQGAVVRPRWRWAQRLHLVH